MYWKNLYEVFDALNAINDIMFLFWSFVDNSPEPGEIPSERTEIAQRTFTHILHTQAENKGHNALGGPKYLPWLSLKLCINNVHYPSMQHSIHI